ncbi:hypothetical protein VTO58DRAFT_107018 [Aureobasidium pullulans]
MHVFTRLWDVVGSQEQGTIVPRAKGLSNLHMQPADPGSGKGMEILAPIKAGTPAPCHSRQDDLPFGRSNQSAGPASGNRAATRHA